MDSESWKPVVGFDGYEVSDFGRVRSWFNGRWGFLDAPRLLNPSSDSNGYAVLNLSNGGRGYQKLVHNLVLEAFAGPRPDGMLACHGPLGNADNSLTNLYWGTPSRNMRDRVRDGTDNRGEKHPLHKLTDIEVAEIRRRLASGGTQSELARRFNVTNSAISRIKTGKRRQLAGASQTASL